MNKKNALNLLLILMTTISFSQTKQSPWSFDFGVNAVNVYPIGEDNAPYGEYFDEFFNLNDHWNMGGFYVGVTRDLTKHLSISARGTSNELSKWGETTADESVLVDNLKYYSLDGMVNFKFTTTRLQPYIGVGGGYTWIEEGPYNTFSTAGGDDNLVGAGTVNGALGAKFQLSDRFAIDLQTMYKHTFEDYLTKHWQHSLGLSYSLSGNSNKESNTAPVINDNDGDGVPNEYDLCPEVSGLKKFGGCPDSDGDGVPNNIDKCPDTKGDNGNGCPTPKQDLGNTNVQPTPAPSPSKNTTENKVIYFDYKSDFLDNNAKAILDDIVEVSKNSSTYSISVGGHTDNIGGTNFNQNLSNRRANNVMQYLVSKGLSSSSIKAQGFGENNPVSNNNTEAGRASNRRAELTIKLTSK